MTIFLHMPSRLGMRTAIPVPLHKMQRNNFKFTISAPVNYIHVAFNYTIFHYITLQHIKIYEVFHPFPCKEYPLPVDLGSQVRVPLRRRRPKYCTCSLRAYLGVRNVTVKQPHIPTNRTEAGLKKKGIVLITNSTASLHVVSLRSLPGCGE
jgi:hypothetical protein